SSIPKGQKTPSLRDDWTKVMSKGSAIPTKKTTSVLEPKKSKRFLSSPETENSKRTRDCVLNEL
ncbi:Hypothetical protein FKW44_012474, partial [Caligus rogercresseyi]